MSTVQTEIDEVGAVLRMIADLPPEARKWVTTSEPDDGEPLEDHLDSALCGSVTNMYNARLPDGSLAAPVVALAEAVCLMARAMPKDAVSDYEKGCERREERIANTVRDLRERVGLDAESDDDQEDDVDRSDEAPATEGTKPTKGAIYDGFNDVGGGIVELSVQLEGATQLLIEAAEQKERIDTLPNIRYIVESLATLAKGLDKKMDTLYTEVMAKVKS